MVFNGPHFNRHANQGFSLCFSPISMLTLCFTFQVFTVIEIFLISSLSFSIAHSSLSRSVSHCSLIRHCCYLLLMLPITHHCLPVWYFISSSSSSGDSSSSSLPMFIIQCGLVCQCIMCRNVSIYQTHTDPARVCY